MKRTLSRSCCGSKSYVLELDQPVAKQVLPAFQQAGFVTSDMYTKSGVFFVSKNGLTASGPFGGTKLQVRCGGSANCSQLLDHLENTFISAISPQPPPSDDT